MVVYRFGKQIYNVELDIGCEADSNDAAKILVPSIDSIDASQEKLLWDAPRGLCPTRAFPSLITYFLSNCFRIPSFQEIWKAFPISQQFRKSRERLSSIDLQASLSVNCRGGSVTLNNCVFETGRPGMLAARTVWEG